MTVFPTCKFCGKEKEWTIYGVCNFCVQKLIIRERERQAFGPVAIPPYSMEDAKLMFEAYKAGMYPVQEAGEEVNWKDFVPASTVEWAAFIGLMWLSLTVGLIAAVIDGSC